MEQPATDLAPESHDEAFHFRQSGDTWVRRSGYYLVCVPASAHVCTASGSAEGDEPPVEFHRPCGHTCVESSASARSVLRPVPQRAAQDGEPEAGPDRR